MSIVGKQVFFLKMEDSDSWASSKGNHNLSIESRMKKGHQKIIVCYLHNSMKCYPAK